ncbi:nuclear transport factor 2 family protein [Chitinophaga arvensicola]|nr:nuclear transport factor 2 family protein [Chitinophaga arvensicola]
MKTYFLNMTWLLLLFLAFPGQRVSAQENDQQLAAVILRQDSLFWQAYNTCDLTTMVKFFSDDVEFYHDKGGITNGIDALVSSFQKGVCNNTDSFRLRRAVVKGSIKLYPMRESGVIYGAILSGEHLFYVQDKGKKERAEGLAKFTHLWILKNGAWKMTRVLSYDHGPAPYINERTAITLPTQALQKYVGKYKGPQTAEMNIQAGKGILLMIIGSKQFELYPEKEDVFFSKERDLTFEFVKQGNAVKKLIIRERDEIAETLEASK